MEDLRPRDAARFAADAARIIRRAGPRLAAAARDRHPGATSWIVVHCSCGLAFCGADVKDLVAELTAGIVRDALSRGVKEISIGPSTAPAPPPGAGAPVANPAPPLLLDADRGAQVRFRVEEEDRPVLIVPLGEDLAGSWARAARLDAGVPRGRMRIDLGGGDVAELEVARGASPEALTLTVLGVSRARDRVPRWVAVGALAIGGLLVAVSLPSALPGNRAWLGVLLAPGLALFIARWVLRPRNRG